MLILLDHRVTAETLRLVEGSSLCYRPELSNASAAERAEALAHLRPDVLITHTEPSDTETTAWRPAVGAAPRVAIVIGRGAAPRATDAGTALPDIPPECSSGERTLLLRAEGEARPTPAFYTGILTRAERAWWTAALAPALAGRLGAGPHAGHPSAADTNRRVRQDVRQRGRPSTRRHPPDPRDARHVILVGAGIVNLVTALSLIRDGYRVTLLDASPDPRSGAHWSAYGGSSGGGDARMFTLTEADGYHRTAEGEPMPFNTSLAEGGWLLADRSSLTRAELDWAGDNARIPAWLGRAYTDDVLSFNRSSEDLWRQLLGTEFAAVTDGVGLRERVLRLYTDPGRLRTQIERQDRVGATRGVFSAEQLAGRHPALQDACAAGAIAGGIEVVGFTVQIHRFIDRLIGLLEDAGAVFHWQRPVAGLFRDSDGRPDGLLCEGETLRAGHYVLSPGAYGRELLRGTAAQGLIHSVLGAWITLPNLDPQLTHSLKISWPGHRAEDANVTVTTGTSGEPQLVIGSGYGWTGSDPANIDPRRLEALYDAIEETAERFFPKPFAEASNTGLLKESRRYCPRPWTASSLPVMDVSRHAGGGLLVVTGGHNTGGFAQAPAVAQAVSAALGGRAHPMHTLYHPDRFRSFLNHP
jgi:glycine/D-amino acid oxidase-like deaminating enzyme